jgi:hypothetical protein
MLLPISPELIKNILVTNFDCFQDRLIYYNKEDDPISAHLLALEGKNELKLDIGLNGSTKHLRLKFECINPPLQLLCTSNQNSFPFRNRKSMARATSKVDSNFHIRKNEANV